MNVGFSINAVGSPKGFNVQCGNVFEITSELFVQRYAATTFLRLKQTISESERI